MALSTSGWASGFIGFLGLIMTTLAVFVVGVLCRNGFALCLGLVALFAHLASRLTFLPGVVAFGAVLNRITMLLVCKADFPIGGIKINHIFGKGARDHQQCEQKPCNNPYADQSLSHCRFTPSLFPN